MTRPDAQRKHNATVRDRTPARPLAQPESLRTVLIVSVLMSLAIAALVLAANATFYHDDAYIPLRYARNALAGLGPVWNPGERVQGYTSPLQLGMVYLLGLAGVDLRLASRAIGIACCVVLVAGVAWLQSRLGRTDRADPFRAIPFILVVTSCPLIVWAVSGLETLLFAVLVAAGCLLFRWASEAPAAMSGRLVGSAVCLGLAVLARPEGALFFAVCLAWLVLPRGPGWRRNAAAFAGTWLVVLVPWIVWQWLYYGSLLPNTFHAKVGVLWSWRLSNGLSYVGHCLLVPPYIPLVLAALLAARRSRIWTPRLAYVLSIVVAYVTYVVLVGGDHMAACRFLVPVIVPLAYGLYLALRAALPAPSPRAVTVVYAVTVILAALQVRSGRLNPQFDKAADVGTAVGFYMARTWPAGSLVAVNTAGSTPYHAPGLRFIDMLGLNDAHIGRRVIDRIVLPLQAWPGHMKGDGRYVLSREPDYIVLGPAEGSDAARPSFLSDLEIAQDPRFAANYHRREAWLSDQGRPVDRSDAVVMFVYYQKVNRADE